MQYGFFKTPFSKGYWQTALLEFKTLKILIVAAIFIALRIAISSLSVPISQNLSIKLTFIPTSIACMVYGPCVGICAGFVSDILGWILTSNSPFFIGYTLSEMLSYFLYGIYLYRARISLIRVAFCKLTVNLICNVVLGSLWTSIMYSKGFWYYFVKSLTKNILLLPAETAIVYIVIKAALPVIQKAGLLPMQRQLK